MQIGWAVLEISGKKHINSTVLFILTVKRRQTSRRNVWQTPRSTWVIISVLPAFIENWNDKDQEEIGRTAL